MAIHSFISAAQVILEKCVSTDLKAEQAGLDSNTKSLEANRKFQEGRQKASREAAEKAEKASDRSFFESVLKETGIDDQGEGDAKADLDRANADLQHAINKNGLEKKEQAALASSAQATLEKGTEIDSTINKALAAQREIRLGG